MLKPIALRAGDTIGIVAPASPVREEFLEAGEAYLREMGFRTRRGTNLMRRTRYTAGTAVERAGDLITFLTDPGVRAIWCARGGYGSPHLPPLLPAAMLRADPKLIIGGSDITALLLWSLKCGVTCLHGPMPAQELARGNASQEELLHHLSRPAPLGELPPTELLTILHPGRATGRLTGGCLSLVVASLGTPWEIETDSCLLFLEDVDTKPYQLDRMLTQLRQAGKLNRVAGILFGPMLRCRQTTDQGYRTEDVLADLTRDLGVPVVLGFPCGHTEGIHRPLPLGVKATLGTMPPGLWVEEAVVK